MDMKDVKTPSIYKIICVVNNKMYIGSAMNSRHRYCVHVNALRKDKHDNKYLQNSWNKYGEDSFLFRIIEKVEDGENLIEREQFYMDLHESYDRKYGFNICPTAGSSLGVRFSDDARKKLSKAAIGRVMSEATRKKISDANRGDKNPNYGKSPSEETLKRMSEAHKGTFPSEEARKKMSKSQKGRDRSDYGKNLSEESRKRISEGQACTWEVTDPSGEIQIITNLKKFSKEWGLHASAMSYVAQGKQSRHKGWKCRKVTEDT